MKTAWNPDTMGYKNHEYREIDPDSINPEDYAQNMWGEQTHKGEIREYEVADNKKHPENFLTIDWVSRIGAIIECVSALGEGSWEITKLPVMKGHTPYAVVSKGSETREVSMVDLGVVVGDDNCYIQVPAKLIQKITIDRKERERLTKLKTGRA